MICSECKKEFTPKRGDQSTCLARECIESRSLRQRSTWRKAHPEFYRSTARICLVCRKPFVNGEGPNQRAHKGRCTEIWREYCAGTDDTDGMTALCCALSDEEYAEMGIEPPTPGFTRCLGYGLPAHEFWSPDTRKIRICQKCKRAAEHGRVIHHGGSVNDVCEDFGGIF